MPNEKTILNRVEFMGLDLFLQKAEGRMSRKELVELIARFFSSRGLKFYAPLRVEFRATRRPKSVVDGKSSLRGRMHPGENRVEIFLNSVEVPMTFKDVIGTIGHELDHAAWELEGKEFDDSLPYEDRPHEIRARQTGERIKARF